MHATHITGRDAPKSYGERGRSPVQHEPLQGTEYSDQEITGPSGHLAVDNEGRSLGTDRARCNDHIAGTDTADISLDH